MSMLEMEYQLLGDALKKIPNEPHLINAQLTVLKKVGIFIPFKTFFIKTK